MFTDRFIKVPIRRTHSKDKDLTGKENTRDTFLRVSPFDISNYGPSWDDDADGYDELTVTAIHLKCGESFTCYMSFNDFEKLLNNHDA